MKSIEILMHGAIDYAGLFPPAGLDMATSVANYRDYRTGNHRSLLGRFIVPVARLGEFEEAAGTILKAQLEPWPLSALPGEDLAADIRAIVAFNRLHAGAVIDTIELNAEPGAVADTLRALPESVDAFFEIPWATDPESRIRQVAARGRKAKIRTGGLTAELIPPVAEVARFIDACRRHDVAFKATAGLHHPVRSPYNLTYETDSKKATMHGFINVMLAACLRHGGTTREAIEPVLAESRPDAFSFDSNGGGWGELRMLNDEIESARLRFMASFGSCSFEEPIDELKGLGLL